MTTVLRESGEAAGRERLRLEAGAGRSRAGAAIHRLPTKLRYLGSEDAARSGLRYQPVAWTAIALVAVAFFFPGRDDSGTAAPARAAAQAPVATVAPRTLTTATTVPVPVPPAAVAPAPVVVPRPSGPTSPTTSTTTTTTTAPRAPVPLSVRGYGWASSLSGSGVSTAGVPEGTMPVATRIGQLDKVSFVRLAGTATTLTLVEDPGGGREAIGAALVVACPITDAGWAEESDQSLDDAPPWDATACVTGTEQDNTWVFDLAGFADRSGPQGFALVPDASAPPDFQVTFRAS